MQLYPAISRAPDVSSVMAFIRLRTTVNLGGVAKQMRKSIPSTLRQKKVNHVHIHPGAPTVMEIIKWTPIYVCSGGIGSITNDILRNTMRSVKTDQLQFVQPQMTLCNEL